MALSTSQVLLYVADPADYDIALGAAAIAGIPASNVINEFGYAWSDVASGDYLVIAVGAAALYALYYNQCGWNNPAGQAGGSTPFQLSSAPMDTLPGADYYENAAGSTATDTLYIAAAFAYYALHGSLPSNFSTYPTPISPSPTCSGSDALSCPCITCVAPTVSPACSDYGVCGFVSEYEDWAKYAACRMGSHPFPLSLILAQWGDESGYGGSDICTCNNPGNQGASCGIGNTNCSVSGCPEVAYCSLKDGVDSYANLMAQGYPFVACTYEYYANSGNCAEGVKQAAIALGQGYSPVTSCNTYIDYCGYSGTPSASTPRIWASGEYNDGNGPGSALYDTIQANSCLYNLDCTTS